MKLADFAGTWRIERRIDDRAAGRRGHLDGAARFEPDGEVLRYTEEGVLHFPGIPPLAARQRHVWSAAPNGIAVAFADGRPFHAFRVAEARAEASHECPPDIYRVAYDFAAWPDWRAVWTVTGPRKDHRIETRYRREGRSGLRSSP